jgi:hypothetical protein
MRPSHAACGHSCQAGEQFPPGAVSITLPVSRTKSNEASVWMVGLACRRAGASGTICAPPQTAVMQWPIVLGMHACKGLDQLSRGASPPSAGLFIYLNLYTYLPLCFTASLPR